MREEEAIAALDALAQQARLAVFRLLVQAGPKGLAASSISAQLGTPASSMSFHLKELTRAGLISPTRAGRSLIYAANFATMGALIAFLTENCCGGNACAPAVLPPCVTQEGSCP